MQYFGCLLSYLLLINFILFQLPQGHLTYSLTYYANMFANLPWNFHPKELAWFRDFRVCENNFLVDSNFYLIRFFSKTPKDFLKKLNNGSVKNIC